MRPIALIRASGGLALAELLREIGAPVERLWERNGLPPIALLEPERLVPFHLLGRFAEDAAADQGIDDLGVRLARRSGLRAAGSFGAAIFHAPTLHAAIERARDAVVGHNSGAQYWTVLEGESVRLCRHLRHEVDLRQSDLHALTLMVDLVRSVAGADWRPARIELQSRGAAPGREEIFSEAKVETSRPVTSITFPRAFLARSRRVAASVVPPASSPEQWLATGPPTDFVASLEVVIGTQIESGRLDVHGAAEAAGWSLRSLQRRLTELRVSYSEVVDRVRFRLARELLRDERVKIIEVALATGYSDAAHFTRAFRRWTSVTPLEYRRLQVSGESGQGSA